MRSVALLCVVVVVAGCASTTVQNRTAQVVGVYQICGGPPPGHCYIQKKGSVTVLNSRRAVVASLGFAKTGRFDVSLAPGRYTLVATNSRGMRWSRSVNAVTGTTTANIDLPGFP